MGNIDRRQIFEKQFDEIELQKVQAFAINEATTKTDQLLELYRTFKESHKGRYINSDLMKMVFEIYAKSTENRKKYNLAITNSAACLTNELYLRTISDRDIKRCVYIAGPYGAGKSFFAQSLFFTGVIPDDTIVYEGSITAPAFGKKVQIAMENNIIPEIIILNPTLELSLKNIKEREETTGRGVIKSEVVEKYTDIYSNMQALFTYLREMFPEKQEMQYPISFQIYNKNSNVPEDLQVSFEIDDLKHGTRQEVSAQYDCIIKQLQSNIKKDDDEVII